jgi:hypothetical protein
MPEGLFDSLASDELLQYGMLSQTGCPAVQQHLAGEPAPKKVLLDKLFTSLAALQGAKAAGAGAAGSGPAAGLASSPPSEAAGRQSPFEVALLEQLSQLDLGGDNRWGAPLASPIHPPPSWHFVALAPRALCEASCPTGKASCPFLHCAATTLLATCQALAQCLPSLAPVHAAPGCQPRAVAALVWLALSQPSSFSAASLPLYLLLPLLLHCHSPTSRCCYCRLTGPR